MAHDHKTDLLYIRLDSSRKNLTNKRISEDVVLDIGKVEKIVGIEIFNASRHVNLESLLPIEYKAS